MESLLQQPQVIPSLHEQVATLAASKLVPDSDVAAARKSVPDGSSYLVSVECAIDVNGQGCLIISKRGDLCFGHRSERKNKKLDVERLIRAVVTSCDGATLDLISLNYDLDSNPDQDVYYRQVLLDMITTKSSSDVSAPITFNQRGV
jgi:hypothetical protein